MPQYEITATVDAARHDSLVKKLKTMFGEDANIFTVEKLTTPESRGQRLQEAGESASDARNIVEELIGEMRNWYDSMPENLQGGAKAEEIQDCISQLEDLESNIEAIEFGVEFPGMIG